MQENNKYVMLKDVSNLNENIGFHFTQLKNMEGILREGFKPMIGDNASGRLGSSAIPKTYLSYGLEGALQLYNRLITMSYSNPIIVFDNESYKYFIPNSASNKEKSEFLSIIEGFEMIRQYMEKNIYFIISASTAEYEHNLSEEELHEIDNLLREKREKYLAIIEQLRKFLFENEENNQEEIASLINMRNQLAIDMRLETLPKVNEKRGNLINANKNPIIDFIDYQDERPMWEVQEKHNMHTRIIGTERPCGCEISPNLIRVFSTDNKKPGSGLDFLNVALQCAPKDYKLHLMFDYTILYKFQEYLNLVEKYKSLGLLVSILDDTQSADLSSHGLVMDLRDISRYPGLENFIEEVEEFHEANRYKVHARTLNNEVSNNLWKMPDNKIARSEGGVDYGD